MADVVPLAALGARFCDIALNFSDDMFDGVYHNKARHKPDRAAVLQRAAAVGCDSMLIIAGSLEDAYRCVALCAEFNGTSACRMATTIGFHPTRCLEARALDQDLESRLSAFVQQHSSAVAAIGEIGLDYDRLEFCPANVQLEYFELQLRVLTALLPDRPLLLHMRNSECFADFCRVLEQHMAHTETRRLSGVVHSFTGTRDEMERLVALGLSIGINGCSLRDAVFLQHVLPYIPAEHLLYETDAPYCDVRCSHGVHMCVSARVNVVV